MVLARAILLIGLPSGSAEGVRRRVKRGGPWVNA